MGNQGYVNKRNAPLPFGLKKPRYHVVRMRLFVKLVIQQIILLIKGPLLILPFSMLQNGMRYEER